MACTTCSCPYPQGTPYGKRGFYAHLARCGTVATGHAGSGSRSDGPGVDYGRVAELSCALGFAQPA